MEATPSWIITILYWLHMLATVIWIGGLAGLLLLTGGAKDEVVGWLPEGGA